MARKKAPKAEVIAAGLPATIDITKLYRVRFATEVKVGAVTLSTNDVHVVTGAFLTANKGSVYGAVLNA